MTTHGKVAHTPKSATQITVAGQMITDLIALRKIIRLYDDKDMDMSKFVFPQILGMIKNNLEELSKLLRVDAPGLVVHVMRLQFFNDSSSDVTFVGASEEAVWKCFENYAWNNWEAHMPGHTKPDHPDEAINEFIEHAGVEHEIEALPVHFLTGLRKPNVTKKVDLQSV